MKRIAEEVTSIWHYVVVADDGLFALSLAVGVDSVSAFLETGASPVGLSIFFHVPPPECGERDTHPCDTQPCKYVRGGRCLNDAGFLLGRGFFEQYGSPQFEQPESFWAALEAEAVEWRKREW